MKLKRIMAIVLCFAMVLSTMSFNVFAEDEIDETAITLVSSDVLAQTMDADGNVIGEYADFESALAKACEVGSGVARIEILGDITQTEVISVEYYDITNELTIGSADGENYTVSINPVGDSVAVRVQDGGTLTIEENITIDHLDVVANGFSTTDENMNIDGTLKALSLKQWTSNGTITVSETGKVWLGFGDGQFDMAYGNGTVIVNGNGDETEPQFKAGYSGTRGDGNTLNLNDTYFEGGAWFTVNGSNGTFNVDNSLLKVSGGDGAGSLTVASTGNTINLTNGSTLDVANLTLGADNELTIDGTSQVKVTKLIGNGTITIDAATLTAESTPIVGDASEFTGSIELINNDDLKVEIDDNGNIVFVEPLLPGEGTGESPYLIENLDDFIAFAKATQNDESFSGKTIKLTADIDFEGANFLEIAEDGTVVTDYRIPKFSGTFDGDGHAIKNFNYVVNDCGKHSIMMFSQDNMWAYIKNLNIENVNVNIADISGETRVTALANRVNAGGMTDAAIKDVHVKNFKIVSNNTTSGNLRIGGLAYFVQGSQLIAKDCSIDGFEVDVNEALLVGGAVAVVKSKCDFENVDVKNAVFNIDNFGSSGVIGGFVGQTQDQGTGTTFTDCDVEVEMTLGSAESLIGGFVGSIGSVSQFYNCTTEGSITVETGEGVPASIGGFSGDLGWNGMYAPDVQHEFNGCVADVGITAVNANVGGFIGNSTVTGYPKRYMPTYFNGCEAKGDVKTDTGAAGGFVGTGDRGIFNNCVASGDATGKIAGGFWGEIYPKAEAESTGGWSYQDKVVTHTDVNSKSIVLEGLTVTGTATGTEYEAGLIGFMKDIYVNADDTLGYATPIVLANNNTSAFNRYSYGEDVAYIGSAFFTSLQDAIDAAQPDDTIVLLADVNENVTINKNITLDGANKNYTGTMTANAGITATVQNVNFVNGGIDKSTKSTTGNYTIKNCTFDGKDAFYYPLRFKGAASVTVEDCTAKDYVYSFLYVTAGTNTVSVKNVTVEDCPNYAVYFASGVNNATIENLTVKNSNNGLIINNSANRALTIKDCKMENVVTAINHSGGTNTITCTVLGANDFGTSASSEYAKYVLGENATLTAVANLDVTTDVEGYFVKYVDGTYKSVKAIAQIGDVKFDTLAEAFKAATAGCTITLLDDITVSEPWDCRYNGAKFTVPVTIDGNEKTLKLTGKIEDMNWNTVFRFEADATVKNLTIDASEATSIQRGISSKYSITVDNCTLIGNGTTAKRGVIFGEAAGADINNVTATIKDSVFKGWSYGISDNQSGKDAKAVSITGSDFENASVLVSASETVVFNGNDMDNGYVNISSYSVPNVLSVTAKDNTLDTETYAEYNTITAQTIDAQDGFIVPVAEANGKYYISLADAVSNANTGDTIKLLDEIVLTESIYVNEGKAITVDLNGKKLTGPDDGNANWYAFIVNGGDLTLKDSIGTGELWAMCYGIETKSGSFTMESGKITATNNQSLGSAIVNYGGNVTVKGGTLSGAFAAVHTAGYFADAATELEGATINGIVSIENYDSNNYTQTVIAVTDDADDLPAVTAGYEWKTVGKVSKLFKSESAVTPATVKALADNSTVKAGDTVVVQVIAEGFDFTNGDWELRYDPTMFELNANATTYYEDLSKGVKAQSVNSADANTLSGEVIAVGGALHQGNEIPSGTVLATYTFTVLPQSKDTVSGNFDIVNAHINTYDYAISQTNVPAIPVDFDITIIREGREITGSLEVAILTYNGDIQKGNAFVVSDSVVGKDDAVITYSKTENGIYTTELPTFKEAGSYSIWVKVNVDGYAEYKVEHAYMIIGAKDITLSLEVAAGAAYNKVNVKPVITGVYDAEFEGTLTISGVDYTYTKDDFIYMGNNMAIAKEAKPMSVVAGSNEVTITYTQAATDNYADASTTTTVDADKAFATQTIVDDLNAAADAAVTYTYNGTEHKAQDKINAPEGWSVTVTRISDGTANPGVTKVAEKEFVEIRFTHDNYNDVVISRVLKVEPLDLTIIVPDFEKGAGEPDDFTTQSVTYTSENFVASDEFETLDELVATGNLNVAIVRKTFGEDDGIYDLTATYTPNDNYDIVIDDGKLTIGMPNDTVIEVVNNNVNGNRNSSADYVFGYRLVLVYTNTATARYTYDDKPMFDLSNAGYEYFDNTKSIADQTEDNYKYVYGIIVKAETGKEDAYYADKVDFIGTNKYVPEKIVYDADINYDDKFTNNDTSSANSVFNVEYELDSFFMYYFLKADYDRTADGEFKSDKMVKLFDVQEVQKFINTKTTIQ